MQLLRVLAIATVAQLAILSHAYSEDTSGIQYGKNAEYWEARFGAGAYDTGPATPKHFSGAVLNGEILAPSPEFLRFIGAPRPYIGSDFAISDDEIHVVYFGLNWEAYITQRMYLGFSGGGSWNSSEVTTSSSGAVKDLGSSTLFHLQVSAGFDFTSKLTMQLFYNHFSNANLVNSNTGLESVGARLGLRY